VTSHIDNRRRWFEEYVRRIEQGVVKPPWPGVGYSCPCCGYPTLQGRGAHEICLLCNWEDDGQDDPHADEVWGGPNGPYSLAEARENFDQYLVMYSPNGGDPRVGGEDSPVEKQAKRAIVEAFDRMVGETDPTMLGTLWQQVSENERILVRELLRRIGGYQAHML
jgi:hypothetical protein